MSQQSDKRERDRLATLLTEVDEIIDKLKMIRTVLKEEVSQGTPTTK